MEELGLLHLPYDVCSITFPYATLENSENWYIQGDEKAEEMSVTFQVFSKNLRMISRINISKNSDPYDGYALQAILSGLVIVDESEYIGFISMSENKIIYQSKRDGKFKSSDKEKPAKAKKGSKK